MVKNINWNFYLLVFLFPNLFALPVVGQITPANNELFLQSELARIDITIPQDDLANLLLEENQYSNFEYEASFKYTTLSFSDSIAQVGFRLRGNTSRSAEKKSFKVSFNSFVAGQKYRGVEKLNLNGNHNDVSVMRAKLANDLLIDIDPLGSRTSYVRLFINGEYKGLYLNVEHIDEEFIQKRFGNEAGSALFKCNWGSSFEYEGPSFSSYQDTYELKFGNENDAYGKLLSLITMLYSVDSNDLPCEIEQILNVPMFLKSMAFEILIGHWDGYVGNKNNFYLYFSPQTNLFHYISYDLDNTFGIDWFDIDWSQRNIYEYAGAEVRPLFTKLLEIPMYKDLYSQYIKELLQENFIASDLVEKAENLQALIQIALADDTYYPLDYGFNIDDFNESITVPWGNHIPISLGDYFYARANATANQLDLVLNPNLCILNQKELKIKSDKGTISYITDLLGRTCNLEEKQQIYILHYENGFTEKVFY